MTPAIAVIILNWNGAKLLPEYLPKVVATTDLALSRIILADNGSTDGSVDYVRSAFTPEQVELMLLDKNYGFAEGYNRAIAAVADRFDYVVLLNSDVATTPGWDRTLFDFMQANPDVAACQPKVLSYTLPDTFEYAGASGGYLDCNGYPYCRGRIFATCERDEGQYDSVADVHWATGAALMVRPHIYIRSGGLDPDFFAHMEEIDLCWRIRLAGYRICAVPASVVYHLGGGSLPAENPRKTYLNFRNNLLMLHKNLPEATGRRFLIKRRLLDTLAWAKFVATLDLANATAIVRAHRDFARMRRSYTDHPDCNLLPEAPSLLSQYYLRGKRRFSQLDR